MNLKDKVAIVTGGASGIGLAIAHAYAREGAHVAVADLNLEGARAAAEELGKHGPRAMGVAMDVTKEDMLQAAVFLGGFETNALTGQSLVVSHGWFME